MNHWNCTWTDERTAEMKKLWLEGLSANQIAGILGGLTRNAVIGKVHRMGLVRPERTKATRREANRPPKPIRTPKPTRATVEARAKAVKPQPTPPPKPVLLTGREKVWTERVFGECAYPVAGEGADTLSCCAPTEATYCAFHKRLMFTAPRPLRPVARSKDGHSFHQIGRAKSRAA